LEFSRVKKAEILLVNPWITDFAAYDLWAKPLGLLYLGDILRRLDGVDVRLLDCLDLALLPRILRQKVKRRRHGTGHYFQQVIAKPEAIRDVSRHYKRYGLPEEVFRDQLEKLLLPDVVLVTSHMTYWYPGVQQTIQVIREIFPDVVVILGGIYATLCTDHARLYAGADHVVTGADPGGLLRLLKELDIISAVPDPRELDLFDASPAWDLYREHDYLVLLTSLGCPYRCPYCASARLSPGYRRRSPEQVFAELEFWLRCYPKLEDIAFYDDALLLEAESSLVPLLEKVMKSFPDLRFHTPNGLHVNAITPSLARLMKAVGFITVRLSLETTSELLQAEWGGKTIKKRFEEAIAHLLAAGYLPEQLDVYLLVGVPGQCWQQVKEDVEFVKSLGLHPRLTEYSPLPGTALWPAACESTNVDLAGEPLFHNNTLVSCGGSDFLPDRLNQLKQLSRL
jgi:radical SAM superfamily enzyme YgiQ (UPF0313 family)